MTDLPIAIIRIIKINRAERVRAGAAEMLVKKAEEYAGKGGKRSRESCFPCRTKDHQDRRY